MLYIGYLIILGGQSMKKSVSEISIFELPRPENCMSRWCALDPLVPPPPHTPKYGEKHMQRGQNMLYIRYLIILDGQSMKKSVSEISIFELPRPQNRISRLCALDPLVSPPHTQIG